MTSGHRHETVPHLDALTERYSDSRVPSLFIDEDHQILDINGAARKFFDGDEPTNCRDLRLYLDDRQPTTLGKLLQAFRASSHGADFHTVSVHALDNPPVEVRFFRAPTSTPIYLCQLRLLHLPATRRRVELLTEVARLCEESDGFADTLKRLVQKLHRYLYATALAIHHRPSNEDTTWIAGGRGQAQALLDDLPDCSATTTFEQQLLSPHTLRLVIPLPDEESLSLVIDYPDSVPPLSESTPFWQMLCTTTACCLRNAQLLDANRQRNQRLRAVLEHMPMSVMLFDTEGKVLDLNLRARALSGRRSWTQVGIDDHPFEVRDRHGNLLPREEWPLLRALTTRQGCEEEEYILDLGTTQRQVSLTVAPIVDDDGQPTAFLATGRDVTRRSQKDRRKDEFLSVASHELRSPLTPLSGFLQICRQQVEQGYPVDPAILRKAELQVERLQRLIDTLLDTSRLQTGRLPIERRTVVLNDLLRQIIAPWQEGPQGHRIHLDLPTSSIEAAVDPDRLEQVICNVVDNAIKHGRAGGSIHIELHARDEGSAVTVEDEGDGISQEIIDRVFDPFFTSSNNPEENTGIGLYVARQIVTDHGGTIAIDSGPGEPTKVTISLPPVDG